MINFPTSPTVGDIYTFAGLSWQWNGVAWQTYGGGGGAITVANDTTTATPVYPLFADTTSGSLSNVYTSDPNYEYTPSTGQLEAPVMAVSAGIFLNANTITQSYTIPAGYNGLSAGPVDVVPPAVVTVPAGSTWIVA